MSNNEKDDAGKRKSIALGPLALKLDSDLKGTKGAASALQECLEMGVQARLAGFEYQSAEKLMSEEMLPLLRLIVSMQDSKMDVTDELVLGLAQQLVCTVGGSQELVLKGSVPVVFAKAEATEQDKPSVEESSGSKQIVHHEPPSFMRF